MNRIDYCSFVIIDVIDYFYFDYKVHYFKNDQLGSVKIPLIKYEYPISS